MAGVLAVAFSGYLAAVYLAADARRLSLEVLVRDFRLRALLAGVAAGALALAGLLVVRSSALPLWHGLMSETGLALVVVSGVAGSGTLLLVSWSRFGLARVSAALAVAAVVAGWAAAQQPYLLPGLTVRAAAAGRATLIATITGVAVGAAVLVPSLALLYTLVLRGRLDPVAIAGPSGAGPSGAGPSGAGPSGAAGAAGAGGGGPVTRGRAAWAGAVVSLVAGVGLLIFAGPAWALGIGALLLVACAVTVFALTAVPEEET
jgi:cytochrome d ubiquinol oxidase subunit II